MLSGSNLILALILIIIFLFFPLISLYTDYLWFGEIGYSSVFTTILSTKVWVFSAAVIGFLILSFIGIKIGLRGVKKQPKWISPVLLVIAIFVGIVFSEGWETVLAYMNSTAFGTVDPIFSMDLSFYFFQLPFYQLIWGLFFSSFLLAGVISFLIQLKSSFKIKQKIEDTFTGEIIIENPKIEKIDIKNLNKLFPIIGILLIIISVGVFLHQYSLLYSGFGTVIGAGWVDVNITLPFILILTVLTFLTGIVFLIGKDIKWPKIAASILIIIAGLGSIIIPLTQTFIVSPDEFNKELPFLERNIEFTRTAYGLDKIQEFQFPAKTDLTIDDINSNEQTIKNVRLWDWRPLLRTYKQLQLIRTYYDFEDADVDRYRINDDYKQVIVSAREVNPELIPGRSWVNEHMVFTHGYGLTMTPVREITDQGLPLLYIQDIPPQSDYFDIEQPEIYFGELTSDYSIVNTLTEELDYPLGEENVYTTYQGEAGIGLDSILTKIAMTLRFKSLEILFSDSITSDSKILMNRNILDRVDTIAPFIGFDNDPYIVLDNGKIYWMMDGYTLSDKYPYSEQIYSFNYVRNSLKIVVDAYTGETTYYVIEEEPVIQTYMKMFPDLFVPFEEMPKGLKEHVRYPEDLFLIQQEMFSTYHMKNARVFYNKEDVWEIPNELYESNTVEMEPYYLVLQLPDQEKEEYVLLQTFTPKSKNNIVAWMAARSDFPNYGKVLLYNFPKEKFISGPMQLEARIDQDPEISQLFTLWSQAGSSIIRGHITVLPIEDSLLYIEPIYLRASQEAALPELTRVIVAFGDKIVMQPTLDQALEVMFEGKTTISQTPVDTDKTIEELSQEALEHYEASQEALKNNDWTTYGEELALLEEVLNKLNE